MLARRWTVPDASCAAQFRAAAKLLDVPQTKARGRLPRSGSRPRAPTLAPLAREALHSARAQGVQVSSSASDKLVVFEAGGSRYQPCA